jgi:hypothetical protein
MAGQAGIKVTQRNKKFHPIRNWPINLDGYRFHAAHFPFSTNFIFSFTLPLRASFDLSITFSCFFLLGHKYFYAGHEKYPDT